MAPWSPLHVLTDGNPHSPQAASPGAPRPTVCQAGSPSHFGAPDARAAMGGFSPPATHCSSCI
eukprot:3038525-Alexandrium_andersonii.AAC.1